MKKLKFKLALQLSRIIEKMAIREELSSLVAEFNKIESDDKKEKFGIQLMLLLFEKISKAETETCEFFTELTGIEDIMEADLDEVMKVAIATVKEVDWKSFFQPSSDLKK